MLKIKKSLTAKIDFKRTKKHFIDLYINEYFVLKSFTYISTALLKE